MIWKTATFAAFVLYFATGCGSDRLRPEAGLVDCSQDDGYEFLNISNFSGSQTGWFRYADPTPGSIPDPDKLQIESPTSDDEGSNVPPTRLDPPRCPDADSGILRLEASGHNFWGSGFGDWEHNGAASRADGAGFDGIAFWARSERDSEKSFLLNVDEGRTIILDDEGLYGPGDVVPGTECRLPPPEDVGAVDCYNGGVDQPSSAGTRVPELNECGNAFHTLITTTETWQLFLIPWKQLLQWPCPNRLDDGINPADIAKFEIKFDQGTSYDLWIDDIAFYRPR